MALLTATNFRKKYFAPGSGPDSRTIKSWIEKGLVAGRIVGTNLYIDEDKWESEPLVSADKSETKVGSSPLLDTLIARVG